MPKKIRKIGFLEEAEGVASSIRLIFTIGSFWNMVVCTYLVLTGAGYLALIATFTTVESALLGMKLGQKHMETTNYK